MSRRVTERIKAREAQFLGKAAVEEMVTKLATLPPDQIVEPKLTYPEEVAAAVAAEAPPKKPARAKKSK